MKQGRTETGKTKRYSGVAATVKQTTEKKVQEPLPRLSYDKIKRLYDEYGFASPDVKHVQEKLPNDEQRVRKILDHHRKVVDEEVKAKTTKKIADMQYHTELYKQNQKNHLNMIKQQAKLAKQSGLPPHMAGGATGGPGVQMPGMEQPMPQQPMPMEQGQNVGGEESLPPGMAPNQQPLDISNTGDAFFVGDFALVKLVNPGVQSDKSPIWLIDVKNKVLRPFMSQRAFDAYFGSSQDAYDAIVVLPSSAVSEGGPLGDFKMMNSEFGIKEDGSMRKLDHSPAMISRRYGKPVDEAAENRSVLAIDGLFKKLKSGVGQEQPQVQDMGAETGGGMGGPGYGYDGVGGPGVPPLNITRNLEPGMSGDDVKQLQDWLKAQGFLNIANTTTHYGDMTKNAVAAWQKSIGLDAGQYPGYFGPRSLAKAQAAATQSGTNQDGHKPGDSWKSPDGVNTLTMQDDGRVISTLVGVGPGGPLRGNQDGGSSTQQGTGESSTGLPYNRKTENGLPLSGELAFTQLNRGLQSAGAITTISNSMIEKVKQDPSLLAFYINALTYGGYTLGEVFKDIKRRELVAGGKKEYEDMFIISGDQTREEWAKTKEGRTANTLPEFNAMKPGLNNIDPSIFDLPLYDIPDDAFKQLIPILDPSTPEFKAEIEKIQSVMHDIQVATINAKTEQEKAAAEYEYEKFKETINKTYGIQLSNNAQEAWKQIENIGTTNAQAGISKSGIENEAVDDLLRQVRQRDNVSREDKLTKEEAKMVSHYSKFATPEEIKKLIDEDIAKGLPRDQWRATKWGLVPSQDVLNSLDISALKQKYPDKTDEELRRLRDGVVDKYGNYRSDLSQRQWNSLETERVTDVNAKTIQYTNEQLNKEKEAYKQFTAKDIPYLRDDPKNPAPVTQQNVISEPKTDTKPQEQPMSNLQKMSIGLADGSIKTQGQVDSLYGKNQQLPPDVSKNIQDSIDGIKKSISGLQSTTPQAPTTPTPATPKIYNTLYDYYSANGGWNTWNSTQRQADAKKAGITNYTGDEKQNAILLKSLRGY